MARIVCVNLRAGMYLNYVARYSIAAITLAYRQIHKPFYAKRRFRFLKIYATSILKKTRYAYGLLLFV